jgi:hypothetical protein
MTPNEFVIWLKGFTQAANNFTCTPKQWDDIKDQLDKVYSEDKTKGTRYTLDNSNWNTTTTTADGRNDITYKQDELTTNTVF